MPVNNRIAIVGAASLRGKELNEALGESPFASADFVLMDDEEAIGQLESVGDEVTFIQQITPASFAHTDFTFFTGSAELTRKHWQTAAHAGSAILDLSGALDA
jgi:aspartate-semialdehyde dehydrogenase